MKEEETISRRPQKVRGRREDLNRRTHAALQGNRRTSENSERKAESGDSVQRRNRRIVHKQKKENTSVGGAGGTEIRRVKSAAEWADASFSATEISDADSHKERPLAATEEPAQKGGRNKTQRVRRDREKDARTHDNESTDSAQPKTRKGKKPVRILFLGGVGEIGKNMTAIEYGNDIIVIDAGDTFPDEEMPGVDLVVPDASYLVERKDKIRGILLTHGHEDHIGGLAYLLKELNPRTPVYGTKLTLALADNKVREHRLQNLDFRTVKPGDKVKLGAFSVEFVNVNHSIAGAVALAIRTPYGIIYHSGDFKIDMTPVAGDPIDLQRISELGKEGVLLYLGESTNIERPGYTMSETVVGNTLDHLFAEHASRRLVIATFASNVHRLQQIIDLAAKYNRRVALSGRSMLNVVEAATKIGELNIPDGLLVDVEKARNYFDREIVIVSTGSQGEPMSALTRMASGEFNKISIGENDTIIISANPIPGNEKMIYRVINNLYKKGASVVYESLEKIHVSGHACREEHKILHTLLKPKFFIPVHGEYRHLKLHADLAHALGMPRNNILLAEIGNCVEVTANTLRRGDNFSAGAMIIDGTGSEDFDTSEVIRDRKKIASEGVFVISVIVSGGEPVGEPRIENIGILFGDERDYEKEIKGVVMNAISQYDLAGGNADGLAKAIEKMLKGYLYKKTKQSPLILPVIMEI